MYVSDDEPEPAGHDVLHREAERLQEAIAITKEEQALQRQEREGGRRNRAGGDVDDDNEEGENDWIPLKQNDDRTVSTEDLEFYSKSTNSLVSTAGPWSSPSCGSNSPTKDTSRSWVTAVTSDPVPFEEVIATALKYMTRYPPNSLVDLAKRYYQDDWDNQLVLLRHAANAATPCPSPLDLQHQIALLRPCPTWSIVPTCTSDWVIKQRLRQTSGSKSSSRKQRRRKQKTATVAAPGSPGCLPPLPSPEPQSAATASAITDTAASAAHLADPMKHVLANPYNLAVIAVGYGPGLGPELRLAAAAAAATNRRRRKRLIGAVVIGILVVGAIGVVHQQQRTNKERLASSASFSACMASFTSPSNDGDTCRLPTTAPGGESSIKDVVEAAASVMLPRPNVPHQPSPHTAVFREHLQVPNSTTPPAQTVKGPATPIDTVPRQLEFATLPYSADDSKSSSLVRNGAISIGTPPPSPVIVGHLISFVDQWGRLAASLSIRAKREATLFVDKLLQAFRHFWTLWRSRLTS